MRSYRVVTIAWLVGITAGGCDMKSYCVRRSALVPAPAPSLRPELEPQGYVEADIGSETAMWARPPRRLAGANVGLYVPREQLSGYLLFSPRRFFSLGLSFESGLAEGAVPVSPGLIDPPSHSIGGAGVHLGLHFKVQERVTIGWTCDLWFYRISSRVAFIQSETCDGLSDPRTWPQEQRDTYSMQGRTQLAVGVDLRWSHLTVGVGLRNQAHNVDQSLELHATSSDISPRLSYTAYPYVYLTWEFRIYRGLYAGLAVYQPLNFDPVIYAPIIGVNLRLTHLARERTEWEGPAPTPVPVTPL
jgi:hypothetical protein